MTKAEREYRKMADILRKRLILEIQIGRKLEEDGISIQNSQYKELFEESLIKKGENQSITEIQNKLIDAINKYYEMVDIEIQLSIVFIKLGIHVDNECYRIMYLKILKEIEKESFNLKPMEKILFQKTIEEILKFPTDLAKIIFKEGIEKNENSPSVDVFVNKIVEYITQN